MEFEVAAPDPRGTILSLSSLGYSLETAVADLVDNSLAADARRVDVIPHWDADRSWIAVRDNGRGMSPAQLDEAMTISARGPHTDRGPKDLGRFGMGLKTASFSQARRLTVHANAGGGWCTRTWDLDVVETEGAWLLGQGAWPSEAEILCGLEAGGKGTIVLWTALTGALLKGGPYEESEAQKQFYEQLNVVSAHLGMTFERYLRARQPLSLSVGSHKVEPWDPFLMGTSTALPVEDPEVEGHAVRVRPFVLPHRRQLGDDGFASAAGPAGWLGQQGYYVYRRNRLIVAGDWLGLGLRKDEKHVLARIAIDVRKASTRPPLALRRHLRRIAASTRAAASHVLSHRGAVQTVTRGPDFVYPWRLIQVAEVMSCRINRDHPLVREVVRNSGDSRPGLLALLRLLEEGFPLAALRVMLDLECDVAAEPFATAAGQADPSVSEVAARIFSALLSQGASPREARERLGQMYPFDRHPDVVAEVGGSSR